MSKEKIKPIDPRGKKFVDDEGKIDVELLKNVFDSIVADAIKCNKGTVLAGRRFRVHTVALEKQFLEMRKVTPIT